MIKLSEWIVEATIWDMQKAMEQGLFSSEELVAAYLERIDAYDGLLHSVLERNPEALAIARELDAERRERGSRGALHGIPLLLKDNIDTGDRMHTSCGSIALESSCAAKDAFAASRLRAAGAVLLGKANMTEWANFMSDTMWAGYSSRGGLTLNPYGPGELFVGGSSSGSAAAVAANLAAAALGTETAGSIISPASQNCVVGIKPTVGLVSRTGVIPASSSQDTVGPIARTVADAAIVLGAIAGPDAQDAATAACADAYLRDYTPCLDAGSLNGARLGVPRGLFAELDAEGEAILQEAIRVLQEQGAVIVDPVTLPNEGIQWEYHVIRYEFKRNLNAYLAALDPSVPVRSLRDVIAFNEQHAERALKYGQSSLLWLEDPNGEVTEELYAANRQTDRYESQTNGIDYVLHAYRLDALLLPGCEDADYAAKAGYPLVTVPSGFAAHGVTAPGGYTTRGPRGLTFAGRAFSEPTLLGLAYAYEQATRHRFPPKLEHQ